MVRFFITFILCLSFIQGFSQEHLMFLGLPIDGTVNEYAAKLKLKGFSVSPKNEYASKGLRVMWRKRSMSTHSERSNPPTFELKIGLKLA